MKKGVQITESGEVTIEMPTAATVKTYSDDISTKASKALSREVLMYHGGEDGVNGFLENGTVYVNADSGKVYSTVIGHELTHVLEGTDVYTKLSETALGSKAYQNWLRKMGVTSDQYLEAIEKGYAKKGQVLDGDGAKQEALANFLGDYLFHSEDAMTNFARTDMNTFQKLWDRVKQLGYRLFGNASNKERANLEALFRKASAQAQNAQAQQDGARYNVNDGDGNIITVGMNESERAEILKKSSIKLVECDVSNNELNATEVLNLKKSYNSKATRILKTLAEKFGVFEKRYSNSKIEFEFDYSRKSLNESVHKQGEISSDFYDFAKLLYVMDDVAKNAVPIEVHTDKYVGTKRENPQLKYDYVLVSAFTDNENIIPVEFHIKEHSSENIENRLYVGITLGKIKVEDEIMVLAPDSRKENRTHSAPPSSEITIPELISKINPKNGNFFKYIPSEMLNEQQESAKRTALRDEKYRLMIMRGEDVSSLLRDQATENGYTDSTDFRMDHQAPNAQDETAHTMYDVDGAYGGDGSIYSSKAAYYYGDGRSYDNKAIAVIRSAQGNPEKPITVYRAVPNNIQETRVRNGDWVAITKDYAREHGERTLDGNYRIIQNTVPAKYLYNSGDSIHEWGYDNGNRSEVYKNTQNNVKTLDVTYNEGNEIIPLSKRFDASNPDIRYSLDLNDALAERQSNIAFNEQAQEQEQGDTRQSLYIQKTLDDPTVDEATKALIRENPDNVQFYRMRDEKITELAQQRIEKSERFGLDNEKSTCNCKCFLVRIRGLEPP